jgi:phage FluMu gp28-like protein
MTSPIFLPYQQRWSQDHTQVKLWEKSRRIGASYGEAADAVLHAAAAGKLGGDVYYISYNKDMTASFVADCATWAGAFHQAIGTTGEQVLTREDGRDIHVFDIPFASGHHIQAFSNNPRNLRSKGRPGDWVIVDEAAFVDDLADMLKAAMAVTMWGGHVHLMSTHNGEDNPFNGLIQDVRAGRYPYSIHRTTLDDALADGLYRRICQVTGRNWSPDAQTAWRDALIRRYRPNEDEELFAIPAMGGGAYLPRTLIEACMPESAGVPPALSTVLRYDGTAAFNLMPEHKRALEIDSWLAEALDPLLATLDPERRHVAGMDFARSGDMTDIVLLEIGADLQRTWRALVELHNVPFAQQRQVLHHVLAKLPRFAGAALDAGGNGAQLAEETADKFGRTRIQQVKFTEAIYRERFPRYKAGLEDRTTTLIRHDDILEDHRAVQLVRGVPKVPEGKTDAAGQRHGDSAIAGLLADMAADSPAGPIEWMPVERRLNPHGTLLADHDDRDSGARGLW